MLKQALLIFIGCIFCGCLFAGTPHHFSSSHGRDKYFKELLLRVELNHQEKSEIALALQDRYQHLYVSRDDLNYWQFKPLLALPSLYKGKAYYALDSIVGLRHQFDAPHMVLRLYAPPTLFKKHDYYLPDAKLKPSQPKTVGGYFNYDLNAPPDVQHFQVNGLFSIGMFGPFGVMNSDLLAVNELPEGENPSAGRGVTRLNTTFTLDSPEKMSSIRLGDSYTQPGMWGNVVGFAGFQIGTKFSTQPRFVSYPLPSIEGTARMPSVVDLYINNALVYRREVPTGAFDINALPALNGQGEMSLVTTDLLGRQQVVALPYYASSNLLRPGLDDYSASIGFVRKNFGIKSNEYGDILVAGTLRRGVTDTFTGEAHGALTTKNQAIGIGATNLIGQLGLVDTSVAISHRENGSFGALVDVGVERTSPKLNVGGDVTFTTNSFEQLGQGELRPPPKVQGTFFVGFPLKNKQSLGVTVVSQINHDSNPSVTLLSASYNALAFKSLNVAFSGLTNLGGTRTRGVFLTVSKHMNKHDAASINANNQNNKGQVGFQYNHNSGNQRGLDYYVSALPGTNSNVQGGASMAFDFAEFSAQAAYQQSDTDVRLNASGGVAYFQGQWAFTRRITSSFGVVQVPGYEGIGVYVENQLVAHTNHNGYAFIPYLRAYDDNVLSIDAADLPLDATIENVELHAVPYYHSAVFMAFDVHPDNDALITLVNPKQQVIPAGAVVKREDGEGTFPVGDDGEVYLSGLKSSNRFIATWDGNRCSFTINYLQSENPLPNLGRHVCQ